MLTVGGAFTKTGSGALLVQNNGALGSPDLILNGAATFEERTICINRTDGLDPDQPSMEINETFTIADASPRPRCKCTSGPRIHITAPDGHLVKEPPGP